LSDSSSFILTPRRRRTDAVPVPRETNSPPPQYTIDDNYAVLTRPPPASSPKAGESEADLLAELGKKPSTPPTSQQPQQHVRATKPERSATTTTTPASAEDADDFDVRLDYAAITMEENSPSSNLWKSNFGPVWILLPHSTLFPTLTLAYSPPFYPGVCG